MLTKIIKTKMLLLISLVGITGIIQADAYKKALWEWQNSNYWEKADSEESKKTVKDLIENTNPSASSTDMMGETALIIAARFKDIEMIKFILENTKNTNFKEEAKNSINFSNRSSLSVSYKRSNDISIKEPSALDWAIGHNSKLQVA